MYKGKKPQKVTEDMKTSIIAYCNRDIVPDKEYKIDEQYPTEWFEQYFSFIDDTKTREQLGNAFYQARFLYKLMSALNLKKGKYQGILKFQIIQYASICEAVIDYVLEKEYKDDIESRYADKIYTKVSAFAQNVKLQCDGDELCTYKVRKKRKKIRYMRIGDRLEFAVEKRIISEQAKDKMKSLYDLRSSVHILKATRENYYPRLPEAKNAFLIMQEIVSEVKNYCETEH